MQSIDLRMSQMRQYELVVVVLRADCSAAARMHEIVERAFYRLGGKLLSLVVTPPSRASFVHVQPCQIIL